MNKLLLFPAALAFVYTLHIILNSKSPLLRCLGNAVSAAALLAAIKTGSLFAGFFFPVNILSCVLTLMFGLPGVVSLLALQLITV